MTSMANAAQARNPGPAASEGGRLASLMSRWWFVSLAYGVVVIGILLFSARNGIDYVGADNDDAMRLVEVRDLLAGQGWYDMMQYRLGLDSGTLMHWSRFIDLPIASLIAFFRLFLAPERAEAAALAIWPLSLVLPFMIAMGLAGRRIGGMPGTHISLGLTALLVVTSNRFRPGSIDHDNVQLVLVAVILAALVDERYRPSSFALAAVAAAIAIGIGAETTPLVAVACMAIAGLWAWEGPVFAPAAKAFALALTISISAVFFALVPPHLYSTVTCDNISLGFYGITSVGGAGLLLSAIFASSLSRAWRFAVLGANGAAIFATALVLAPQCLRSPLADLDPMLVQLWLNGITEAQSILSVIREDPSVVGGFYAVGLFAIAVCIFRMVRGERVTFHAVFLLLVLANWGIALIQVRGAVFSNLAAIPPLTLLLIDLRRRSNADSEDISAAFFYVVGTLIAVPAVWAFAGALIVGQAGNAFATTPATADKKPAQCETREALAPIAGIKPGVVVAPSNMGAPILRFTGHRAISGPYHRDQGGMLTELHIGIAKPAEAEAFLRGARATVLAYCARDPQTTVIAKRWPDGLYAQLGRGNVPAYLQPLPAAKDSDVRFYRFVPGN